MAISSTYTRVTGNVSSHNILTIATRYGELLALLVIPTWVLHRFPRVRACSRSTFLGIGFTTLSEVLMVRSCSPTRAHMGELFGWLLDRAGHRYFVWLSPLHTHIDRECEQS